MALIKAYPADKRLCPYFLLTEYLKRTTLLRGDEKALLISYVKPHNRISKDTVSRWIRTVLAKAGIDVDIFKRHSVRAVVVSKAKMQHLPVESILATAGWSSTCSFAKYYDKPIRNQNTFTDAVLK